MRSWRRYRRHSIEIKTGIFPEQLHEHNGHEEVPVDESPCTTNPGKIGFENDFGEGELLHIRLSELDVLGLVVRPA